MIIKFLEIPQFHKFLAIVKKMTTSPSSSTTSTPTLWKRLKFFIIILFLPLLISFILSFFTSDDLLSPVIMTLDGPVQGKLAYSRNGTPYWQYLSISYAESPTGSLRFQPPVPKYPWKKVRQGLQYPPACIQFEPIALGMTWGVEDCLYLNVFVPKDSIPAKGNIKKKLPILIYIHGGAYLEGQSSFYRPDYIMDHNIIVVTMNYRLGPLGFLNFQETNDTSGKYPRGNMGLKDQNLVLKWVQNNIEQFGGDKKAVTLMGDSAGAVSVHLNMLSKLSRGLFQRAIVTSGSSLAPWGFTKYPRKVAFEYANRLGCRVEETASLFQCYQNMDAHEMIRLQYSWADPIHEKDQFVPSVEILQTKDTFLMNTPDELLQNGDFSDIPLLTGVTSGEGGLRSGRFRAMPEVIPILDQNWEKLVHNVMFLDDPMPPVAAKQLKQYYFGNQGFQDDKYFLDKITNFTSDALFIGPVHRAAIYHAKKGAPTYLFYYDYRPFAMFSSFSCFSQIRIYDNFFVRFANLISGMTWDWVAEFILGGNGAHHYGVGHVENLFQIWNVNGMTKLMTWLDEDFSTSLINSIVDFAYDSKPLTYRGVPWLQINDFVGSSKDDLPYMRLDNNKEAAVISEPFKQRMQFWETLRLKYSTI